MASTLKSKLDVFKKVGALFDRKEKLQFALVMLAALAAALFQALGVVSVLPFVELVMNPAVVQENPWISGFYSSLEFASASSFTMFAGFAILAVLVLGNGASAFSDWLRIRFVWQKSHTLSADLLRTYLSLPYVFFLNKHSADLSKNVLFEVQQLTSRLIMPLAQIATKGVVAAVLLLLLVFVNPAVALWAAFVFGAAYLAIFFLLRQSLEARGSMRIAENTRRFTVAQEALLGIKDIKVLGRERHFLRRFFEHSDQFSRLQAWASIAVQLPRYLMEVVAFGGVIALILVFVAFQQEGSKVIPLVGFFAFAGYRLMPALQTVFQAASEVQFNVAVLDRITEDLQGGAESRRLFDETRLPDPLGLQERISLKRVSFRYPYAQEPALRDITMDIPKGAFVGIAGPTGGGKSTLVDILIGLLFAQKGTMKVDDVAIDHANVRSWQSSLGYVPQQIFLADDTVARNIAFGLPDDRIDRAQLKRVAMAANLHQFIIEELPQGYDTVIGERGIRLSGGQRQRIGIARALYHNPEVLVLDEATNALDTVTESSILEALRNVARFKTLVVVAHRIATMKNCDTIYFVEKGRIINQGTYDSLLDLNPRFRSMAQESKHSLGNYGKKEH